MIFLEKFLHLGKDDIGGESVLVSEALVHSNFARGCTGEKPRVERSLVKVQVRQVGKATFRWAKEWKTGHKMS